ncbi:MAG: putative ATPase of the ABC class [Verrucomicrobia bacterium ADurb.Bin345]|nr:MAG: putative ATPase of the ABC class [Verrucomicrobia bacterium ADurb.Bin345]
MRDKEEFYSTLCGINGKDVSEYAQLIGDFDFSRYVLKISGIQHDTSGRGAATLFILRVPQIIAMFPPHLFNTPVRRTALEDFLTRKVAGKIEALARYDEQGVSRRRMFVASPGQKILPRSVMVVTEEYIEARVYVNLPEKDGHIAGDAALQVFFDDLPALVSASLIYCNLSESEVHDFVNLMEDSDQVRQVLPTRGWVGFVAEGGLLSRAASSDLPDYEQLVSLGVSAESAVELDVPNSGKVRGFGVPTGVTVVLGDACSGRVELMHALAAGIYNHIPGDGREMCITVPDAVYVNAEAGRSVQHVDISAFVGDEGRYADAQRFTTSHADAVSSQAAALVEALEAGARALLLDESDSAPEFLALSAAAAALLPGVESRVTPLAARARQIADELGISIVIGGSATVGDFIPVADTVLRVDQHQVSDITQQAKSLAMKTPALKARSVDLSGLADRGRWVVPSSIDPGMGRFDATIDATSVHNLRFGRTSVDLSRVCQIADVYQTLTIGRILYYAKLRYLDEPRPIREVLDLIDRDLSTEGLESLTRDLRGDLARPRRYEIAAALNRLGTLRITRPPE